jgi:hypothetical protein
LDEPGGKFWRAFQRFLERELLARGMIDRDDLALLRRTDRAEQAVEEILRFYRVYHSMRFVRQYLVLRLSEPIGEELLEQINRKFADLLSEGRFTLSGPLAEERDEPQLAALPRLVFQSSRRNYGRLRCLIDCLNRGRVED